MTGLLALLIFAAFAAIGYGISASLEKREEERQALGRRLATMAGSALGTASPLFKDLRLSRIPALDALLSRVAGVRALVRMIQQAGIKKRAGEILLYIPLLFTLVFVAAQLLGWDTVSSLGAGAIASGIPIVVLQRMRAKRMHLFSEQLPDSLDLIRAALQAGHGFLSALQVVAEEFPDPIAQELREVAEEMRLGLPQREALYNLIERVDDRNLPMLVVGVLIAQESGGNLAEVLDNISYTIRERFKLQRETQVLTAQGRLSGRVLTALPFFVGAWMYVMNPEYFKPVVTTPTGHYLMLYAISSILVGHLVIRRLVRLEY